MANRARRASPVGVSASAVRPVEPDTGSPRHGHGGPPGDGPGGWRGLTAAVALCAVVGVGFVLARFQSTDEPVIPAPTTTMPETPQPPSLQTHMDPDGRFRVGYPEGWNIETEDVTPQGGFTDLVAAGTFEMRPSIDMCVHVPAQLEDMGPDDAFVWIEQGMRNWEGPPRPGSFGDLASGVDENLDAYECLTPEGRSDVGVLHYFSFSQAGSGYWGVIAAGRDAPAERVAEAVAVLDSFDPAIRAAPGRIFSALGWDGERLLTISTVRPGPQPPDLGTVRAFDPDSRELLAETEVLGAPVLVAGDSGNIWVAHWATGRLTRIDRESSEAVGTLFFTLPFDVGGPDGVTFVPNGLAAEDGTVWILAARGALAEYRDVERGGVEPGLIVHDLRMDDRLHDLAVVDGVPWVASGRAVYGVEAGSIVTVELDHAAQSLGTDGGQLLVSGPDPDGRSQVSVVDTRARQVVAGFDIEGDVAEPVTVEGVTGVLDAGGVLHTAGGEAWQTDAVSWTATVQAGPELWAAIGGGSSLLDVRLIGEYRPGEEDVPPVAATAVPGDALTGFSLVADPEDRFRLAVPTGWGMASESLSPLGGAGGQLFAVGTFEMRPSLEDCVHIPAQAVEDMGPEDAFVWVEEGGSAGPAGADQPSSFAELIDGVDESSMPYWCLTPAGRTDLGVLQWITFTRAGRGFYAIVAVGRDAPASRVTEAVTVLDSFDPPLRLGLGREVTDLAWDGSLLWAITGVAVGDGPPERGIVTGIDPVTGAHHATLSLPGTPTLVAGDPEAVWVAHWTTGHLTRLDRDSGRVDAEVELELPFDVGGPDGTKFLPNALVVDGGVAWVLTARGALAEVRDGGEDVTIHELRTDDQLHALAVAAGTPWVASGQAAYRIDGGEPIPVSLDHFAQYLGTDGARIIVAGPVRGGGTRVTSLDARTGDVAGAFDVADEIAGIVTIEGLTGALDSAGVLHIEEGTVALTDFSPSAQPMVQAGPDLYVTTLPGSGLRRVRLLGVHDSEP